jgi:hypothetical protein
MRSFNQEGDKMKHYNGRFLGSGCFGFKIAQLVSLSIDWGKKCVIITEIFQSKY